MPKLSPNGYLSDVGPDQVKRLFGEKILVKLSKTAKFKGKLMIPEEFRRKENVARVVKLGEGYKGSLQVGDIVLTTPWQGREWQSAKEDYALFDEEHILARFEE